MAGIAATYISTSSFSVVEDLTSELSAGRRIKAYCDVDGIKYVTIDSSAYTSVTTVNILETTLTSNLETIWYGVTGTNALPKHAHTDNTQGGTLDLASPSAIGETAPNTIRGLNKELVFSSTDTLDANECAGTIINNYGQSNDATITLPAAASGMSFTVILGTTVAKYYRLDPNASDSIYLNGITTGDGKYVGIASAVLGATISFVAFKTGSSTYDWYASSVYGSWVAEA